MKKLTTLILILIGSLILPQLCSAYWKLTMCHQVGLVSNHNGYMDYGGELIRYGGHAAFIFCHDEFGNPVGSAKIWEENSGKYWFTNPIGTDRGSVGFAEIELHDYDSPYVFYMSGEEGSDRTPELHCKEPLYWGQFYSFEIHFMRVSEPDQFMVNALYPFYRHDKTQLNTATVEGAYYDSDQEEQTPQYASFGQTFVANGNRIVAANLQASVGYLTHLQWKAEVRYGGPTGYVVAPAKECRDIVSDEFFPVWVFWGLHEAQVIPGETYYIRFTPSMGWDTMACYQNDTNPYTNGQMYIDDQPAAPYLDLKAFVIGGQYTGSSPTPTIPTTPTPTPTEDPNNPRIWKLMMVRQVGFFSNHNYYENGARKGGHAIHIRTYDEDGRPVGATIRREGSDVSWSTNPATGYGQINIYEYPEEGYDPPFVLYIEGLSASDRTPVLYCGDGYYWGRYYSWEIQFMRTYAENNIQLNPQYPFYNYDNVPMNENPDNYDDALYKSDLTVQTDSYASFGQTFIANGNRIIAAQLQASIGYQERLQWQAEILEGGPEGPRIGPIKESPDHLSDDFFSIWVNWGLHEVPVTPGETYYIRFSYIPAAGNTTMACYQNENNPYANGRMYINDELAAPHLDLKARVVGCNYSGPTPTATSSLPLKGDANCDGSITPGDALLTFQFYLTISIPETEPCNQALAADIDDNGSITPGDALCIFQAYLGSSCF